MSVLLSNGQSFETIAADFTLSPEFGPAIAVQNNMAGQSITGKRFRIEIPDNWMKPEFAGKTIALPGFSTGVPVKGDEIVRGIPNWLLGIVAVGAVLALRKS